MRNEFMSTIRLFPKNLNGWFFHADNNEIYRGNMEELLSFNFFSKPYVELEEEYIIQIADIISEIEVIINYKFNPG